VDKMLVLDAGRTQHYGPAAEVMKAMQQPKGMAQSTSEPPAPVQPAAQPVRQVVNAAPVASTAPAASATPVTNATAPLADQGARVLDLLDTIHRSGARMSRGIAPLTPPQP
jgi:hypothetical protein